MIISNKKQQQYRQIFNNLPAAIQEKIQNSSVKIESRDRRFIASGVIFAAPVSWNSALVLTAKHNLWLYDGQNKPPAWGSQNCKTMANNFLANIQILYNNQQLVANTTKTLDYVKQNNWEYDLMILECKKDKKFLSFARKNCIFSNSNDRNKNLIFFDKGMVWDDNHNVYIQTGFGKRSDTDPSPGNPFRYRSTQTLQKRTLRVKAGFDNQEIYKETILLAASDKTTTAEGNSGGPLFAVYRYRELYLVGATLGSNFDEERVLPDKPIQNNASTSALTVLQEIRLPN